MSAATFFLGRGRGRVFADDGRAHSDRFFGKKKEPKAIESDNFSGEGEQCVRD